MWLIEECGGWGAIVERWGAIVGVRIRRSGKKKKKKARKYNKKRKCFPFHLIQNPIVRKKNN